MIGIFLQPGANALDGRRQASSATTDELARALSRGRELRRSPYDTTRFVEVSIREVLKTLGEAMLLVFLVVYLFLQSWRATLIPCSRCRCR